MRKTIALLVLLGAAGCPGRPAASTPAGSPTGSVAPVLTPGPHVPTPPGAEDLAATRELEAIRVLYAEAQKKFAGFSAEGTNQALWAEARAAADGTMDRMDAFLEGHPDHRAANDLAVEVTALRSAILQAKPE